MDHIVRRFYRNGSKPVFSVYRTCAGRYYRTCNYFFAYHAHSGFVYVPCDFDSPFDFGDSAAGQRVQIKTLYITLITPLFMEIVPVLDLKGICAALPWVAAPLIAAIAGGILVGAAVGIALNHQCATGGTDVIALLIQYVFRFLKVPTILFCLDGSVVVASGMISGNIWIAGFSLLSLFIIMQTIRKITAKKQPDNV